MNVVSVFIVVSYIVLLYFAERKSVFVVSFSNFILTLPSTEFFGTETWQFQSKILHTIFKYLELFLLNCDFYVLFFSSVL